MFCRPYLIYQYEVSVGPEVWQGEKRYTDFEALHHAVVETLGAEAAHVLEMRSMELPPRWRAFLADPILNYTTTSQLVADGVPTHVRGAYWIKILEGCGCPSPCDLDGYITLASAEGSKEAAAGWRDDSPLATVDPAAHARANYREPRNLHRRAPAPMQQSAGRSTHRAVVWWHQVAVVQTPTWEVIASCHLDDILNRQLCLQARQEHAGWRERASDA